MDKTPVEPLCFSKWVSIILLSQHMITNAIFGRKELQREEKTLKKEKKFPILLGSISYET